MKRHILILIVLITFSVISKGQNCYQVIGDMQGMNLDISSLEEISCQLKDSLPSEFSNDFKVLYYGFYLHNKVMQGGTENFLGSAKALADATSPYYVLLSNQISWNGDVKYFIDIKLPQNWLPYCFDPLIVEAFKNSVKNKFQSLTTKYSSSTERVQLEKEALYYVATKFGKYTSCCIPNTNLRSSNQCSDCISAYDVLNELENLGFQAVFEGQVTNSIFSENQNCLCTSEETSLKENNNGNRSTSVLDFSNLSINLDGFNYNFGQSLSEWVNAGHTAIVTKNKNYCTKSLFNTQLTTFNNAANAGWIHIWENPDSTSADIVFVKTKYAINTTGILDCELPIGSMISDSPPPFKYTIMHRSFAPWDRFGHAPIFWNVHAARNSFHGDNRGFSLSDFVAHKTENSDGVTSRINQELKVVLGQGTFGVLRTPNPFNSTTTGYPYCYKYKIPTPAPGHVPGSPSAGTLREEVTVMGSSEGDEIVNINGKITSTKMRFEGSNPLFVPGPDIDWTLLLNWSYKKADNTINIKGKVCGKSYPAYEAFISDNCGTKVFIHNYQAPCESALGGQLLWPLDDYEAPIDLTFKTNNEGCFTGEMKQATTIYTISGWNESFLTLSPAKDCPSSPCQGCYPNDGTDKRSLYNCND